MNSCNGTHSSDYNRVYKETRKKLHDAQAVFKGMGNKVIALCNKWGFCNDYDAADKMARNFRICFELLRRVKSRLCDHELVPDKPSFAYFCAFVTCCFRNANL